MTKRKAKSKVTSKTTPLVDEGTPVEALEKIQTSQSEVTKEPAIRPSKIAGASNVVAMSNAQLTSELVELKRRFNNLNMAVHGQQF